MVQSIPIETTTHGKLSWEIIHPFAFMWYLSTVCEFGVLMADSIAKAPKNILRLILYGDELTPGNPLRADLGRQAFKRSFLRGCCIEKTGRTKIIDISKAV